MTQGTAQQHLEMIVTITGMTLNTVEVHSQLNLVAVLALCNKGSICNLIKAKSYKVFKILTKVFNLILFLQPYIEIE